MTMTLTHLPLHTAATRPTVQPKRTLALIHGGALQALVLTACPVLAWQSLQDRWCCDDYAENIYTLLRLPGGQNIQDGDLLAGMETSYRVLPGSDFRTLRDFGEVQTPELHAAHTTITLTARVNGTPAALERPYPIPGVELTPDEAGGLLRCTTVIEAVTPDAAQVQAALSAPGYDALNFNLTVPFRVAQHAFAQAGCEVAAPGVTVSTQRLN